MDIRLDYIPESDALILQERIIPSQQLNVQPLKSRASLSLCQVMSIFDFTSPSNRPYFEKGDQPRVHGIPVKLRGGQHLAAPAQAFAKSRVT